MISDGISAPSVVPCSERAMPSRITRPERNRNRSSRVASFTQPSGLGLPPRSPTMS